MPAPNMEQRSVSLRKNKRSARKPNLRKVYQRDLEPLALEQQEFRVRLLRPSHPPMALGGLVESVTWRGDPGDPVMHGEITVRYPDFADRQPVRRGHRVRLDVRWGGEWKEVFTMRLYKPREDPASGTITYEMHDDGYLLQLSRDEFEYRKGKKRHKKGWKCHQIAKDIARQYRIPLGRIAEGKHFIKVLEMRGSPMQALQRAYALEKAHTGRRFVIRFNKGQLDILPLQRNALLYRLGPQLTTALLSDDTDDARWATAVTVKATVKQGKKTKKIETTIFDDPRIKKYGVIHKVKRAGPNVDSRDEARTLGKRYIAKHSEREDSLEITHPGIAFIRRGDAVAVRIPRVAVDDQDGIMFVASHQHSLAGGEFTMSLTLSFDDPYVPAKKRRKKKDKETRARKRASR
jgi:hypothetical protein